MGNATRLVIAGMALFGATAVHASPGPMQVEEPALIGPKPPIQPEKDQDSWKAKKSASLTAAQKAALKARQERMDDMVALIRQKRRAIKEAKPEDRQALANELHSLIIEKSNAVERGRARSQGRKDASREPGADAGELPEKSLRVQEARQSQLDQKARQLEHKEEILSQQEARRKLIEDRLKELENKTGFDLDD